MNRSEIESLEGAIERIWEVARGMGLDPFPTHFELVPATIMYEFGAYGLPGRFSHWTHGRAYQQMKTMYDYGLSKIYELVINTNPSYAFLLENNSVLQNMVVAAHVLGHTDFFKHNAWFAHTSRQMIEGVSANADRIRRYEFQHGTLEVEQFLDAVLSIQEHIDPNIRSRPKAEPNDENGKAARKPETAFDDLFVWDEVEEERPKVKRFPREPEKDLLLFIAEHAPDLEPWQRDILHIVRGEMLYFVPQMQTKVMNEGWASYWHSRIMRELDLNDSDFTEFASMHAGVISPSPRRINPYYVGLKLFEDIERRWDNPTEEERRKFGRPGGEGRAKLFEVRELDNDVSFLRSYLTEDLVEDLDLYIYKQEGQELVIVEKDWERIRDMIVESLTNFGQPYIVISDADFKRNRELYLRHQFEGHELDMAYAEKTLVYLQQLWGRAVHLETLVNGRSTVLSYDGNRASTVTR